MSEIQKTSLRYTMTHLLTKSKSHFPSPLKSSVANKEKEMFNSPHFEPQKKLLRFKSVSVEIQFVSPVICIICFFVQCKLLNSPCGLIVVNTKDTLLVNLDTLTDENVFLKLEQQKASSQLMIIILSLTKCSIEYNTAHYFILVDSVQICALY